MIRELSVADMDAEANAFAMELLMPASWLLEDIQKLGGVDIEDEKTMARLAKKYRVSTLVMAARLAELRCIAEQEASAAAALARSEEG